jgi:hypothetical protein
MGFPPACSWSISTLARIWAGTPRGAFKQAFLQLAREGQDRSAATCGRSSAANRHCLASIQPSARPATLSWGVLGFQTLSRLRVCFRTVTGAAKVVEPTSQPAGRTASMPGSRLQRSGWLPCAMQAAMAADCGLITGLSYGCQRCSSCEQPGSRSFRPPPRRAPAERAGASRGLTGAPQDLQKVRYAPSNPPYRPISCPIRPVLCPSDASTAAFPPWQVD